MSYYEISNLISGSPEKDRKCAVYVSVKYIIYVD